MAVDNVYKFLKERGYLAQSVGAGVTAAGAAAKKTIDDSRTDAEAARYLAERGYPYNTKQLPLDDSRTAAEAERYLADRGYPNPGTSGQAASTPIPKQTASNVSSGGAIKPKQSNVSTTGNSAAPDAASATPINSGSSSQSVGSIQYGTPVEAKDRELRGIQTISDLYGGIAYDRNDIEKIFQDATAAEYEAKRNEYNRSMQQYYDRLGTSQNAYLDTLRQEKGRAINSGYTRGTYDANALSAMLGMSQQTAADNLTLAQQDRALTDQEMAAKSKNAQLALEYSNDQKNKVATLDSGLYAADTQKYVGELGANAQIGSANIAASAQGYSSDVAAEAQRYASDKGLEGQKISAAAQKAAAGASAAAAKYAADRGYEGAQAQIQANLIQQEMVNIASIANSFEDPDVALERIVMYAQGSPLGSGTDDLQKRYYGG